MIFPDNFWIFPVKHVAASDKPSPAGPRFTARNLPASSTSLLFSQTEYHYWITVKWGSILGLDWRLRNKYFFPHCKLSLLAITRAGEYPAGGNISAWILGLIIEIWINYAENTIKIEILPNRKFTCAFGFYHSINAYLPLQLSPSLSLSLFSLSQQKVSQHISQMLARFTKYPTHRLNLLQCQKTMKDSFHPHDEQGSLHDA